MNDVEMKRCIMCDQEKPINDFCKRKSSKNGYRNNCKKCRNQYNKKLRAENPEKYNKLSKQYRSKHPEQIKQTNKRHYLKKKGKILLHSRKWYAKNKEKIKENKKQYYLNNPEKRERKNQKNRQWNSEHKEEIKIKSKKRYIKNREEILFKNRQRYSEHKEEIKIKRKQRDLKRKEEIRIHKNKYATNRRKTNPEIRLIHNLRSRMNWACKFQCVKKPMHTMELLDCTISKYQEHLKRHFVTGMTMENNGKRKWVQHHIIPFSSVDLSNIEQLKKVCHYTNIIPMWEDEHIEWHRNHPH